MQSISKRLAGAAAALAMAAAPVAASANPAASLSVVRAGSATTAENNLAAGPTATLVNIGILAALVVLVLVATDDDEDEAESA
ncbi:hypothetical protein [Sphingomonas lenta]|uniref:Ferrochelatase n=1 Tax=Sphingomonas lenta TaxID=1141887 RepID=A0A2A2SG61_9SPHN|nr:hypothetical protein [Sphingomonas lenta]PAX08239.1 hypothetical protein CKY28_11795 [Sphingomonas lenta]